MTERKTLSPKQRRQRNREEMIEAIVSSARQIMREQGVAALNLNEIARMLGMQTPSLYEYFPNKLALYDHLFRVGTRHFRAYMAQIRADSPAAAGWEEGLQVMTAYVQWSVENPELFKLLFERHVPGFVPSDESMAEMYAALTEGRQQLGDSLRAANLDPGLSLDQALDLFIAIQHGITALHLANSPDLPIGEGRFSTLIPHVIHMLQIAWKHQ